MDVDGASNNRHRVLCERAGLVDADNRRVRHCFTRAKDADKKILLGHTLSRERECQHHSKGKAYICYEWGKRLNTESRLTFRNSDDHEHYRNDKDLYKCHAVLVGIPSIKKRKGDVRAGDPDVKRGPTHRGGSPVTSWTKNLIMSAVKRIMPATLPTLAINSPRMFSLS